MPAALALLRAGIRRLGIIDPDPVELSNLARQIIYRSPDIGIAKVEAVARRLGECRHDRESTPDIETLAVRFDTANAARIVAGFGFVIDATDDPATKFLINDTCVAAGIPFVYGGVLGLTGQLMTVVPGRTACLRCLFESPPGQDEIASCREAGILGPVAGAIGELQGTEAARSIRGQALRFAGRIVSYDAGAAVFRIRIAPLSAREGCACSAWRPMAGCSPAVSAPPLEKIL